MAVLKVWDGTTWVPIGGSGVGTPLYGPSGEIILTATPTGANVGPGVGRYTRLAGPQQDAHLRSGATSGSFALVEARGGAYLAGNAVWDGANWQRLDTAAGGAILAADANDGRLLVSAFPAGANPITLQGPYWVDIRQLALAVNPPRVSVSGGSGSVTLGQWNLVPNLTATGYNTPGAAGGANPFANPPRFTAPVAGVYDCAYEGYFSGQVTGNTCLRLNGTTYLGQTPLGYGGAGYAQSFATPRTRVLLAAGGYVEPLVYPSVTATLTNVSFTAQYISP